MASKGGVTLDIPGFCNLAVEAASFVNETNTKLDKVRANMSKLQEDDGILSGGYRGEAIREALDSMAATIKQIEDTMSQIHEQVTRQMNAMAKAVANREDLNAARDVIANAQKKIKEQGSNVKATVRQGSKQ